MNKESTLKNNEMRFIMEHPFIPVIIGTDINAYNMAISFHEEYGIKPVVVGRVMLPFTELSSIIGALEIHKDLNEPSAFARILLDVAQRHEKPGKKLILVGTNDPYVRLIIQNQEVLKTRYRMNYITEDLMNQLYVKKNFYELCKEHGIDTPATFYHSCKDTAPFAEEMRYPVILKPSNGVEYYKHPFEGAQKVYRLGSLEEVNEVIQKITASGYREDLIIQDYIPGDDSYMWDAVYYADQQGKAQLITYAQVVLQEHTVTAIGNYTALITRFNEEMMTKLVNFLEDLHYVGFANFDLKYDERDGKFKVFEVNIRQGRSSYYVTFCGHNMARYLVDDLIYGKTKPLTYLKEDFLFTVVPKYVLKNFVENPQINGEIRTLIREGKWGNPLFYKNDHHFKRKLYMMARQVNYVKKYRNNTW